MMMTEVTFVLLLLSFTAIADDQQGSNSTGILQQFSLAAGTTHSASLLAALKRQAKYLPQSPGLGKLVHISQPQHTNTSSLLQALQDQSVTDIVLASSYDVSNEFDAYARRPILINRNITITGLHGLQDVLDLRYKRAVLELCSSCSVAFVNVTLAGERRGNGSPIDIFLGRPGSRVFVRNAIKLRRACTTARDTREVVDKTPRSSHIMLDGPKHQQIAEENATFQDHAYPLSLLIIDYSVDQPLSVQEGRGTSGGYAASEVATIRLCRREANSECLATKSPDACVNELIDAVLAMEQEGLRSSSARLPPGSLAAAVAVPLAVSVLVAAGVALWLHKHRRHQLWLRRCQQQQQECKYMDAAQFPGHYPDGDEEAAWGTGGSMEHDGDGGSGLTPRLHSPLGLRQNWQLLRSLTAPSLGEIPDSKICFGDLLGVGSFGRVYRAQWAGRDVAVKVIPHALDSMDTVDNEVQMMLSFDHQNIVRAFYCVTYVKTGSALLASSSITRQASAFTATTITEDSEPGSLSSQRHPGSTHSSLAAASSSSRHSSGNSAVEAAARPAAAAAGASDAACVGKASRTGSCDSMRGMGNAQQLQQQQQGQPDTEQPDRQQHRKRVWWWWQSSARDSHSIQQSSPEGPSDSHLQQDQQQQQQRAAAPNAASASLAKISKNKAELPSPQPGFGSSPRGASDSVRGCTAETWLVLEFCDLGTLSGIFSCVGGQQDLLQQDPQAHFTRLLLLRDAAQGLKVLHSKSICHGDLNARNVLVSSDASAEGGMVAKLADLGLSRIIKQHQTHRTTETVGTMSHMPPELLQSGRMSPAADIYAFGIMMWEVYTGEAAFRKMHYGQFFEVVVLRCIRPVIPPDMPQDYALLMQWCWESNPASRPSLDKLLEVLNFMIQQQKQQSAAHPHQQEVQLLLHPDLQQRSTEGGAGALAAAAAAGHVGGSSGAAGTMHEGPTGCSDSAASRDVFFGEGMGENWDMSFGDFRV